MQNTTAENVIPLNQRHAQTLWQQSDDLREQRAAQALAGIRLAVAHMDGPPIECVGNVVEAMFVWLTDRIGPIAARALVEDFMKGPPRWASTAAEPEA